MNNIPIIPTKLRRVNLAVNWDVWKRAIDLNIDIHSFFRMKLQEAVEHLEQEKRSTYDPIDYIDLGPTSDAKETESAFFDALLRVPDSEGDKGTASSCSKNSERIKSALKRANAIPRSLCGEGDLV